jgi:CDGSH-type Zn-finger protein
MVDQTEAQVFDNGPIKVSGDFVLKDGKGQAFDLSGRDAVALCRCGHSGNKPFCDGSHKVQGFESVVEGK